MITKEYRGGGEEKQWILFKKNSNNDQSILSQKWKSPLCLLQTPLVYILSDNLPILVCL